MMNQTVSLDFWSWRYLAKPLAVLSVSLAFLMLAPLLMGSAARQAQASAAVAQIAQYQGAVAVTRAGEPLVVNKGTRLAVHDIISTGSDGSVGVIFDDETTLTLGGNSEVSIHEYLFDTENSAFSFIVKFVKGTASYVSGLIVKLSPESAKFITPSATIGVRGTKFVIQVDDL